MLIIGIFGLFVVRFCWVFLSWVFDGVRSTGVVEVVEEETLSPRLRTEPASSSSTERTLAANLVNRRPRVTRRKGQVDKERSSLGKWIRGGSWVSDNRVCLPLTLCAISFVRGWVIGGGDVGHAC